MQLWLVVLGAALLWRADRLAGWPRGWWHHDLYVALLLLGWGAVAASVVLTFVAGGTIG